jgi:hypothetical protein
MNFYTNDQVVTALHCGTSNSYDTSWFETVFDIC